MTNFVTASRGDELLFRIDDSVESKPLHTIVTLVSLGMPEAAALCGLTEKTIRQAMRRGALIACYAYTSTVRIRRRGLHGRHEKTPLASDCERSGVSRVPIGAA